MSLNAKYEISAPVTSMKDNAHGRSTSIVMWAVLERASNVYSANGVRRAERGAAAQYT